MKTITATVEQQNLVIEPAILEVAGSVGIYALQITYDSDWDEVERKVVNFLGATGFCIAVVDESDDGRITIPWEMFACPGKVSVSVVGFIGEDQVITTTGLYERNTFMVLPTGIGLKVVAEPTPDVYVKLLRALDSVEDQLAALGSLDDLQTSEKNTLVGAINEVLEKAVRSVNDVLPDDSGNVELESQDIGIEGISQNEWDDFWNS